MYAKLIEFWLNEIHISISLWNYSRSFTYKYLHISSDNDIFYLCFELIYCISLIFWNSKSIKLIRFTNHIDYFFKLFFNAEVQSKTFALAITILKKKWEKPLIKGVTGNHQHSWSHFSSVVKSIYFPIYSANRISRFAYQKRLATRHTHTYTHLPNVPPDSKESGVD